MDAINDLLDTLVVARRQADANMTLFPLLATGAGEPYYLTLEEASSREVVEITEVNEGASIPELKLINRIAKSILVVDGEELVGAKQNRIVNASFLIAGHSEVVIHVSCVEEGRWAYRTRDFTAGKNVMPSSLRQKHQREVSCCLSAGAGDWRVFYAAQGSAGRNRAVGLGLC